MVRGSWPRPRTRWYQKPDAASGCPAQGCPPRFWAPVSIAGVEHGDPRVSLCKLAFDTYWRDPSKTPMFRDLASASRCGRGRTGTLNTLYEDMRKKNIKPVKPSGFVFHESRVGSTLVANMLAAVPTNIVYSESAPPPAVLNHCRSCSKQRKTDILQKLIALMGASPTDYHTHLFFKFQSATRPSPLIFTFIAKRVFTYQPKPALLWNTFPSNTPGGSAPAQTRYEAAP